MTKKGVLLYTLKSEIFYDFLLSKSHVIYSFIIREEQI